MTEADYSSIKKVKYQSNTKIIMLIFSFEI